ncbi:MAG: NAD-dependent epimerase/dehydratase family protein, partial [Nitrososphaerota archaeon]|nr:NAD-dependent epimerase/dehydratase family protein [Nitrososphaerota archaeon]
MKVLVTGSQGFVGRHVVGYLASHGFETVTTDVSSGADVVGSMVDAAFVRETLSRLDFDAVVHLAGASIAGRFTEAHKQAIAQSRIEPTRLLADAMVRAGAPRALIAA